MPGVNVNIPITVRIVGVPTEKLLAELVTTVEKALLGRLAESQRELWSQPPPQRVLSVGEPAETIELARLNRGASTYTIPSYDDAGSPTDVPVSQPGSGQQTGDPLKAQISNLANHLLESAGLEGVNPVLVAQWTRLALLLNFPPDTIATQDDVDKFVDACNVRAGSEADTLKHLRAASDDKSVEGMINSFPEAFPLEWSQRIYDVLDAHVRIADLRQLVNDRDSHLRKAANELPGVIYANGLPYPIERARALRKVELEAIFLTKPSHPVAQFTRLALDLSLSSFGIFYVGAWQRLAEKLRDDVAAGTKIANPSSYADFKENSAQIHRDLADRIRRTGLSEDAMRELEKRSNDLRNVELVRAWGAFFTGLVSIFAKWDESKKQFADVLSIVDNKLSASQKDVRVVVALEWAYHCGYLTEEVLKVLGDLWHRGPEIIVKTVIGVIITWFIAQLIPPLGLAIDIVVAVTVGTSAIEAFLRISDAIDAAARATDVASMQRASAVLAHSLAGDGLEVLKDLLILAASTASISGRMRQLEAQGIPKRDALRTAFDEQRPLPPSAKATPGPRLSPVREPAPTRRAIPAPDPTAAREPTTTREPTGPRQPAPRVQQQPAPGAPPSPGPPGAPPPAPRVRLLSIGARRRSGAQWFLRNVDRAELAASRRGYQVYEYYNREGHALYVGKSGGAAGETPANWVDRGWRHIEERPAIAEADRIVVHAELTEQEAFALEQDRIAELDPPLNRIEGEFTKRSQQGAADLAANVQSASRRPTYTFDTDIVPPIR